MYVVYCGQHTVGGGGNASVMPCIVLVLYNKIHCSVRSILWAAYCGGGGGGGKCQRDALHCSSTI